MSELKTDDEVWFVPGHNHPYLLAIKCKIVEVSGDGDYWLDEPVGHGVISEELFETKFEAVRELIERYTELVELDHQCDGDELCGINYESISTLENYRKDKTAFIKSTWANAGVKDQWQPTEYPEKTEDDWVSVQSVVRN